MSNGTSIASERSLSASERNAIAVRLWQAIQDNAVELAHALLKQAKDFPEDLVNPQGRTPLMWACFLGRGAIIYGQSWGEQAAEKDREGSTAAMWAVRGEGVGLIPKLHSMGRGENLFAPRDAKGRSALDVAIGEKRFDAVTELWWLANVTTFLDRPATWFEDLTGRSEPEVREIASRSKSVDFAAALTSFPHTADELERALLTPGVAALSKDGRTALHVAAGAGMHEVAKALLRRGCDPAALDRNWQTPLFCAAGAEYNNFRVSQDYSTWGARRDYHATARLLMDRFDPMWTDKRGHTALTMAVAKGDVEMARLLLPMSNPWQRYEGNRGSDASRALYQSGVEESDAAACRALLHEAIEAKQVERINSGDAQGAKFRRAAWTGDAARVKAMLAYEDKRPSTGRGGASRTPLAMRADAYGRTAVMEAAACGKAECVRLLAPRSNLLAATPDGTTALMLAAKAEDGGECAELLIAGSHLNARDDHWLSAFDHAALNERSLGPLRALLPHLARFRDGDDVEGIALDEEAIKRLHAGAMRLAKAESRVPREKQLIRLGLAAGINNNALKILLDAA